LKILYEASRGDNREFLRTKMLMYSKQVYEYMSCISVILRKQFFT